MVPTATARSNRGDIGKLCAMMFLEFFVWGGWYVTVGNYMTAHNLASSVPWAYSVCPIAAIISPFFLGIIADRFFATQKVLGAMNLLTGLCLVALPTIAAGGSVFLFNAVLLLNALFFMPTLGLTNTLAFHHLDDQEKQFPLIRVFGTTGWIVAGLLISLALHADTSPIQFYVAGVAALLLGVYSFALPHTPPPAAGKETSFADIIGWDSLKLMRAPSFAVFIICSFLICVPLAAYYSYAPIFVKYIGFKNPAATMSFGQMSEFFFMLVMPIFFARLGVKWMLLVGMAAWVARYGLFTAATANHVLALVIMGIVLHGVCYDFFFVTGQIYVDKRVSPQIRGQAQGFLVLVTQGLGMLLGAQIVGRIVAANTSGTGSAAVIDWHTVWLIPCAAAAVIMVIFFALFRDDSRTAPDVVLDLPPSAAPVEPAPVAEV